MPYSSSELFRPYFDRALSQDRVILTNDKDFGEIIFRGRRPHRGVVLFRLADQRVENRIAMTRMVVTEYGDLVTGAFTVVTERGVRIRRR